MLDTSTPPRSRLWHPRGGGVPARAATRPLLPLPHTTAKNDTARDCSGCSRPPDPPRPQPVTGRRWGGRQRRGLRPRGTATWGAPRGVRASAHGGRVRGGEGTRPQHKGGDDSRQKIVTWVGGSLPLKPPRPAPRCRPPPLSMRGGTGGVKAEPRGTEGVGGGGAWVGGGQHRACAGGPSGSCGQWGEGLPFIGWRPGGGLSRHLKSSARYSILSV